MSPRTLSPRTDLERRGVLTQGQLVVSSHLEGARWPSASASRDCWVLDVGRQLALGADQLLQRGGRAG